MLLLHITNFKTNKARLDMIKGLLPALSMTTNAKE